MQHHTQRITVFLVCFLYFGLGQFSEAQGQVRSGDSSARFEDYINPVTQKPLSVQPLLFEEYFSEKGEAYLYGHYRGPGLRMVLADTVLTLAGVPVSPSITAHKGPVIPSPSGLLSIQYYDLQREGWNKGEAVETIHEKAYQLLISSALVDSVCRTPSDGSKTVWEVWFKGCQFAENLWIFDSMPKPKRIVTRAQKLHHKRQRVRNKFDEIRQHLERDIPDIVFILPSGGRDYLKKLNQGIIVQIQGMTIETLPLKWNYKQMHIKRSTAKTLLNPYPLDGCEN